jgi:hypothetical protein
MSWLIWTGRLRLGWWSGRQVALEIQKLGCVAEGCNVFAVFALDDRVDRCGRVLVRLGSCIQGLVDLVDPRVDVVCDRLFRSSNVARCLVAPADGVSKLLLMVSHRLRVALDLAAGGASPNSRPDMDAVENGCLVTSPSFKSTRKRR